MSDIIKVSLFDDPHNHYRFDSEKIRQNIKFLRKRKITGRTLPERRDGLKLKNKIFVKGDVL